MSSNATSATDHFSVGIVLRLGRVFCLLVVLAAGLVYFPTVNAELHGDSMSNEDVVSGWSAYPVTFDGKITDGREWSDAYQESVVLFRGWFDNEKPPLRSNDTVTATFWVKNDANWVYLLAHVNSTSRDPQGVGIDYFWWRYHGVWDGARGAGVQRDSSIYDWYYVNETYRQFVKPSNVRGGASCQTFLLSGSDCWFELAKMLRSDDPRDWTMTAGEMVGTRPPDLMFIVYFSKPNGDRDYYERYMTLHLSAESEPSEIPPTLVSSFAWQARRNLTFASFLLSPDFTINADRGIYQIVRIAINATFRNSLNQSREPNIEYYYHWPTFNIGATVGGARETFSLDGCPPYCGGGTSNSFYGAGVGLAPNSTGDRLVTLDLDFSRMEAFVPSSNMSQFPMMIYSSSAIFGQDTTFVTEGRIFINLVVWSGDPDVQTWNLMLQNASLSIKLVRVPRMLAMLPRPSFQQSWTWHVARSESRTPIAGLAVSDDGYALAAINAFNDTWKGAEVYMLDSGGRLVWAQIYPHSSFNWNLMDVALTPDRRFAAYAIYSSDNASNAGIWYVDENGRPIWLHNGLGYESVAMSSDGRLVVAVGATTGSGKDRKTDPKALALDGSGNVLWQRSFHGELPVRVSVSPEGSFIAITTGFVTDLFGAFNSNVYLLDKSGNILWKHAVEPYNIARSVDISSSGERIVISYRDGTVEILNKSGSVVGRYFHSYSFPSTRWGGDTFGAVITADGRQIATSQGFGLFIFNGDLSGLLAVPWGPYDVLSVAMSSKGNYIAAGTYEGILHFYVLSSEKSVQYALSVDEAAQNAGVVTANSTHDAMILAQAQGRWLDAYQESHGMVNATLVAMRSKYSESFAQAQADLLEMHNRFNETSNLLNASKSTLDSTQVGKAVTELSEASASLSIAESYLARAPDEINSGNYLIALKFVQRATQAIEEARSQMNDLNMQINGSPSISALNSYLVPMAVVVLVALALPTIWLIRRRGRAPKK